MLDLQPVNFVKLAKIDAGELLSREQSSALLGEPIPQSSTGLLLRGNGLGFTTGVYARQVSFKFRKLSNTSILVLVPDSHLNRGLGDIRVEISTSVGSDVLIRYELSQNMTLAQGSVKLANTVLKVLLSGRGDRRFRGAKIGGGGARELIGRHFGSSGDMQIAVAEVVTITTNIITDSQNNINIPPDEKLSVITIVDLRTDPRGSGRITVGLDILSKARTKIALGVDLGSNG